MCRRRLQPLLTHGTRPGSCAFGSAGVDEAGRGPLAGPVVAAACVIPCHVSIPGIDDSKKVSEAQREELYALLTVHPEIEWAV